MSALIGDMSQPLGLAVGNALEVKEAIETLHGYGPSDFRDHCVDVAREMLIIADKASESAEAAAAARKTLADGSAWAMFRAFVAAQGGDMMVLDEPERLPQAPLVSPLLSPADGYVAQVDAREVGYTVVDLGGGRARKEDSIDPAVGVVLAENAKIGRPVSRGAPLLWVHAISKASQEAALRRLSGAIQISDGPVEAPPLIHTVIR